jgi:Fe-S oxidoreductase
MSAVREELTPAASLSLETLCQTPEGKRLLSCIQCGTCAGTCPHGEYMDYPPRRIIKMLEEGLLEEVFKSDSLLKCVSCFACEAKCPRDISLTDVLLPLVKEQVLARAPELPAELQKSLENMQRYGNPMGESPRKRSAWTKAAGVPVRVLPEQKGPADVLWFVECYTSFYPRGQDACRATARILNALKVDFAILGHEEKCAGECGRRAWEPGLSDMLMEANLAVFKKYSFNRIVTTDPHALDALRHRYAPAGLRQPVEHAATFLARQMDRLKPLLTKKLDRVVTYHDPCCLGRHNDIYDEPRALLDAIPGVRLVEMLHNRANSICCGGGGGGMWLDTFYKGKEMERLSDRRVREAVDTGADVLAVSCPYEVPRFEDALKILGYEKKMVVRDVTELLAESLGG